MPVSEGQLNGARDYRARIDIWYSGAQDWAANTSRFDWRVELIDAAGWGSWTNATCEVWANIGGVGYYGTFTIPSNTAGQNRTVLSGSTWIGHDGEGHRPGFASDAYIKVPHSNIGEGGSGQAWVDAPRIPQIPAAPNTLRFRASAASPVNLGVEYNRGDNRGSAIEQDRAHWYEGGPAGVGRMIWEDLGPSGYTSPNGGATPGAPALKPGTPYYVYVSSRNVRGWGPWAGPVGAETLSGGRVKIGGQWVDASPWVKVNGQWRRVRPYFKQAGSFRTVR